MKFKLFLPFISFILIIVLFAFKMIINEKFENVIELRNNKISFLKIKSIISGDDIKLKSNKDKYIFLHFFSTWCKECISELSELKILQAKNIPLYGVAIDEERDVVANCLRKMEIMFNKKWLNLYYSKWRRVTSNSFDGPIMIGCMYRKRLLFRQLIQNESTTQK